MNFLAKVVAVALLAACLVPLQAGAQVGQSFQRQSILAACIDSPAMEEMPFENGRLRATPPQFCACFVDGLGRITPDQAQLVLRGLSENTPPPAELGAELLERIRSAAETCQVAPPIDPSLPFAEKLAAACQGSPDLLPALKDEIIEDPTVPQRFCTCLAGALAGFSAADQALVLASVDETDSDNAQLQRHPDLQKPVTEAALGCFRSQNIPIPEGWDR